MRIGMANQGGNEQDLQVLASLLTDIESQLTSERDQSEWLRLKDFRQRCLIELALIQAAKRRKEG
jgi:hypothetical protein